MSEPAPKSGVGRAVLIIAGVMLVLLVVMSAVGVMVIKKVAESTEDAWSADPLLPAVAKSRYGIDALPRAVTQTQQLRGGFQDGYDFALLRIPPKTEEAFMRANGLSRDPVSESEVPTELFEERIRALTKPAGPMRVTLLSGQHVAHMADGGEEVWPVNATLLEFDDQVWVALVAIET